MDTEKFLRQLPSVEKLLSSEVSARLLEVVERPVIAEAIRRVLDRARADVKSGDWQSWFTGDGESASLDDEVLQRELSAFCKQLASPSLKRVINATGIIIHTNLGRSILCQQAVDAVCTAARHYTNLEYDLTGGKRSQRAKHVSARLAELCRAEAGFVVNNNAAAVLLGLNTLANGKEVIVSRGELVEIGGSFRMPDVMRASGAVLREVGATNKTKLSDYEGAINDRTGLILKVHTSNYRIVGFSHEVSIAELHELAAKYGLPLMVDLGSGLLTSVESLRLPGGTMMDEPVVSGVMSHDPDITTFSADKLLGASQAGVIVGKQDVVSRVASNQLTRALRIDKLSLAALDATLSVYSVSPAGAIDQIPTLRMLCEAPERVAARAKAIAERVAMVLGLSFEISMELGSSKTGGGSCPLLELPTTLVCIRSENVSAATIDNLLRSAEVPVVARIADNRVLIDPRTVQEDEIDLLLAAFEAIGNATA